MKRLLLPLVASLALPNAVNADIRSYCFNEWGENYEMVEYCMKQQSAALQRIGGGTYNDNNFDTRKYSNTINALPFTNYIIVGQKMTYLK